MPTFSYRAVAKDGGAVTGSLTAENYQVAMRMLEERSLVPVNVREGAVAAKSLTGGTKKIKLRYLTTFYSQLADLLRAGVPMLRSLDVLARQSANAALTEIIREVREDVSGGMALAEAFEKHPNAFNHLHCAMIRAGESGGFLEDVLSRISVFAERQDELRNKVVGAMIYPAVLLAAGAVVLTFLMVFVVPKLGKNLKEEDYNVLTYIVMDSADILEHHFGLIILGLAAIVVGVSSFLKTDMGLQLKAKAELKAPVAGKIFVMMAVCRFCRILGTMLGNGVPILQSLKISKDSAGNPILAEQIEDAAESVRRGEPLSAPLATAGLFPPDILDMIAVAEESNSLENVLVQIADTNEARTARQIDLAVRLIEPLLLMLMAGMVLCIALALLLPILSMSTSAMRGG